MDVETLGSACSEFQPDTPAHSVVASRQSQTGSKPIWAADGSRESWRERQWMLLSVPERLESTKRLQWLVEAVD